MYKEYHVINIFLNNLIQLSHKLNVVCIAVGEEFMFRQAYDRTRVLHVENSFFEMALTDKHIHKLLKLLC